MMFSCSYVEKDDGSQDKEVIIADPSLFGELNQNFGQNDGITAYIYPNIIFGCSKDNKGRRFYSHNLLTQQQQNIGEINQFTIGSFTSSYVNEKLFFFVGIGEIESLDISLFQINLKRAELKKVTSEKLYGTLVHTKPSDELVLSLKSKMTDRADIRETFIDSYNPTTKKRFAPIKKSINSITGEGQYIASFDCYQDEIYILCGENSKTVGNQNRIEIYDIQGTLKKSFLLEDLDKYFHNQVMLDMIATEEYVYLSNFSGDCAIFEFADGFLEPVVVGNYETRMKPVLTSHSRESSNALFFIRDTKHVFVLENDSKQMKIIDVAPDDKFTNLKSVFVDNKTVLYRLQADTGEIKIFLQSIDNLLLMDHDLVALTEEKVFDVNDYYYS